MMGVFDPIFSLVNFVCDKIASWELWIYLGLLVLFILGVYLVFFV